MSYDRNIKWLNDRRVIYRREPVSDIPTIETDKYMFYENGTYQHYHLFNSKAKITTYRSLKWHMLVIYHLNKDNKYSLSPFFEHVARFVANKENGFVTFFIKQTILNKMIKEVFAIGDTPPRNRIRKVIFKPYTLLTLSEKLSIVGKLIGRGKKIVEDDIYECMLSLNNEKEKITINKIAKSLNCSSRTIYRNMGNQLKLEKELLNSEL